MNEEVAYLFYHRIQVHEGEHHGYDIIETLIWKELPWTLMCKYKWYFEYRAALLKVKYPKYKVNHDWGKYKKDGKSKLQHLKSKESAARGQVTKIKNDLSKAEKNWNKLFPITDNIMYRKKVEKLKDKQVQLEQIQNQIKSYE